MLIAIDGNEANISQRVGINQWAFELIKHLQALPTEHQIVVFLKDRPLPDLPPATPHFSYEVFGPRRSWVMTGLTWRLLKRPRPDVLFSPSHYIPLLTSVKRVFSIVDLSYEHFGADYFKTYDLQQLKQWTRRSARVAQKIVTISEHSRQDIEKLYHVPSHKIQVIYPGYNTQLFHPRIPLTKQKQVREKYGITGKYFVFLGTLQPRKNISRLIEAFAQLGGGTKLVIVGKKGWLYDEIYAKVQKLNLQTKVIFTGFAPTEDIPALMKTSIAYVLPSLYEGFGIPVVEAQACGTITVVSRVSSLPEVAGESAIYIDDPHSISDIAESLRTALSLPRRKRDIMIAAGKQNAARFSWEKAAKETLDLLTTC